MGYQALLFCPDEKTARSVTQVLGELEFSVDACTETFAAVKKLMGEHFDAVVVDCDNEQNATLLFKSARNSTSNQSSLAVAVVEGQAGVAKAFRIGANLVLTKPINVEQAKGTLRVARGLLRKGESGKPATPAATTAAAAKPAASTPVSPAKPAPSIPRPAAPAVVKLAASPAPPAPAAMASTDVAAPDQEAPASKDSEAAAAPVMSAPVTSPASETVDAPPPAAKLPALSSAARPATLEEAMAAKRPAAAGSASFGSGAASAPALARDILEMPPVEVLPAISDTEEDDILESPAAEPARASSEPVKDVPPPSFTLGGVSAPEKSSGGSKKMVVGLATAAIVVAGVYFGWTYLGGHSTKPVTSPAPVSTPSSTPAVSPSSTHTPPAAVPSSQPAARPVSTAAAPATNPVLKSNEAASGDDATNASPTSANPENSGSKAAPETTLSPLVVKGGSVQAKHEAPAAEAQAPSVIGIATPDSSAPLPNLVGSSAPGPVLQRLNVSQGVSTGLLIKKVAPTYPATALHLRIEGAVQLLATISKAGDITEVKVLSGDPQLSKAATTAVKQWKYKPYLLNGEPVEIQTQITMNFKLPH